MSEKTRLVISDTTARSEAALTPEQKRVAPDELRKHAIAQGTDQPSSPRGRNPDSAMCEDHNRPGMIDKSNDC